MMLSEVPFENLKVEDRVISAKGTPGKIVEINPEGMRKEPSIRIHWDNNGVSYIWHYHGDCVVYVGREGYMP